MRILAFVFLWVLFCIEVAVVAIVWYSSEPYAAFAVGFLFWVNAWGAYRLGQFCPSIRQARRAIWQAMKDDPEFREIYEINAGMVVHDVQMRRAEEKPWDYRDPGARHIVGRALIEFLYKEENPDE